MPDAGEGWILSLMPAADAREISRRPRFRAQLDRRLLPGSVDSASVRLESGPVGIRLVQWFEPVTRELVFEPTSGALPLRARTAYRIRIQGLVDLDGQRMPDAYTAVVHVGDSLDAPTSVPRASWADVAPIFERRCADAACHDAEQPALGLDLSSGPAIRATAINVPSRQFPRGTTDVEGARGARSLAALPIIDVLAGSGSPVSSYLVYKILGDPHILGAAMPPPTEGEPAGLPLEAARMISSWIRGGASTD